MPAPIAAYLGNADNSFRVTKTSSQLFTNSGYISFQDTTTPPNHDQNGLWTTNDHYDVPINGQYTFHAHLILLPQNTNFEFKVTLERWDAGGTGGSFLGSVVIYDNTVILPPLVAIIDATGTINANATDTIYLKIEALPTLGEVFHVNHHNDPNYEKSYFECTNTADGGGIYQTYDPSKYLVVKNSFEMEIKKSQTDIIEANPLSQIDFFIQPSDLRTGFIESVDVYEFNGTAKLTLIQGEGFPPPQACAPTFGDNLVACNDFSCPDSEITAAWTVGHSGDWVIDQTGAKHNASASIDSLQQEILSHVAGKIYRFTFVIIGMTAGTVTGSIGDTNASTATQDGTYELVITTTGGTDLYSLEVSADFDGKIVFTKLEEQLTFC